MRPMRSAREVDARADHRSVPDPVAVLRSARSQRLTVSREDLRLLFVRAGMPEVFVVPSFISDFLGALLQARHARPHLVVDLWATAGWMLPPLVATLRPTRAIGILSDLRFGELAELVAPADPIRWCVGDARAAATTLEPGVDIVLGCPPWRWQPRHVHVDTPDGPLILMDDPANVALLEACARLAPDGVGVFIVGPGFLMRPGRRTAFPNLERFGFTLQFLLELPRGALPADSGSGRMLIGIGPTPCPAPLIDSLTPDSQHTAGLLDTLSSRLARDPTGEAPCYSQ